MDTVIAEHAVNACLAFAAEQVAAERERFQPLIVKRQHYYCEDTWYSCPKHEEGCANDAEGKDCNCGADKWNALIEAIEKDAT